MKSVLATHRLPAVAFGLLLAGLGFTYALATSGDGGSSAIRGVGADRAFGTICSRPPVQLVTSPDLGTAVIGSQLARQLVARFGFKPHNFSFAQPPLDPLTLSSGGALLGIIKSKEDDFVAIVADGKGLTRQTAASAYRILGEAVAVLPTPFHFVAGPNGGFTLPVAVSGEPYQYSIQVNGGIPPYFFTASDADIAAIPPGIVSAIADPNNPNPLFGSNALLLTGKPTKPTNGPALFTITCKDSAGTSISQQFSLTVLGGTITSDFLASSGKLTLAFGKGTRRDSLTLDILLNKSNLAIGGIRTKEDLNNVPFSMTFGGVFLPPFTGTSTSTSVTTGTAAVFDKSGTIQVPNSTTRVSGTNPTTFKVQLDPVTGILKAQFKNISMIHTLGADFHTFVPVIPVNIKIGTAAQQQSSGSTSTSTSTSVDFDKTDLVSFVYKRSPTTGSGNASKNQKMVPGGLFILTKVTGTEAIAPPNTGSTDTVELQMSGQIRQPGGKPIVINATDQVSVILGQSGNGCIGTFPASSFQQTGEVLTVSNSDTKVGLKSIKIDNKKGTFLITTHPLSALATFGVDILTADVPNILTLSLTFGSPDGTVATFDGQTSAVVFRKGTKLQNK
jgi:hypothetical protein